MRAGCTSVLSGCSRSRSAPGFSFFFAAASDPCEGSSGEMFSATLLKASCRSIIILAGKRVKAYPAPQLVRIAATFSRPASSISSAAKPPLQQDSPALPTQQPSQVPPVLPEEDEEQKRNSKASMWSLDSLTIKQIAILTTGQFLVNTGFGVILPVLPTFAADLELAATSVGVILSAPAATRLLLNLPFGKYVDAHGRKPMMILGAALTAVGSVCTGLGASLIHIIPARMLVGVGSAASIAGSQAYMADVTEKYKHLRASIMGISQTAITAAMVTGPALGGWLVQLYGARPAFFVIGAMSAACSLAYLTLPETLKKDSENRAPPRFGLKDFVPLLKTPNIQGIIGIYFVQCLGYSTLLTIVPLQATAVWEATAGGLGSMYSTIAALGFLGAPLGGWLADRIGRKAAIIPAILLIGAACGGLGFSNDFNSFIFCIMAWGLGNSLLVPGLTAMTVESARLDQRGKALALSRQAGDFVFLVAPVGLGLFADFAGLPSSLFFTSVFAFAGSAFFIWRTSETNVPLKR